MKTAKTMISAALMALAAHGGVPVVRTVDVGAAIKPIALESFAGETLDLSVQLAAGGAALATPSASATLYWQTNGMAGAWWSTNLACSASGLVTGAWTPSLPAGRVWFFAGVESAGLNYRMSGQLTVRPSPGSSPSTATLPPPGGTLNLGDYTVIGAPWITSADAAGAIAEATGPIASGVAEVAQRVAAAAQAGTNYTDAVAAGLGEQVETLGGRVDAQGAALGNATNALNARIDGIVVPDVSGFATKGELQSASNALAGAVQTVSIGVENASNALAQATAQLAQTVAANAQQGAYDLAAVSNALAQVVGSLAQTVAENAQQGAYDLAAVSNALAQATAQLAQTVADNAQQSGYDLAAVSNALAQATAQLAQTVADNAQQGGYDLAAVSNALAQATAQLAQTVDGLAVATTISNTAYRLATLDGQTFQDATGVVWRASVVTNISPWYVTSVYGEQTNAIPGVADWTLTFETNELDAAVGPYAGWFLRFGGILVGSTDYISEVSPEDIYAQVGVPDGLIDFSRTNIVSYGVFLPVDRVLYNSDPHGGGGGGITSNEVVSIFDARFNATLPGYLGAWASDATVAAAANAGRAEYARGLATEGDAEMRTAASIFSQIDGAYDSATNALYAATNALEKSNVGGTVAWNAATLNINGGALRVGPDWIYAQTQTFTWNGEAVATEPYVTNAAAQAISTNNPAFVAAVTNCPVVIAAQDAIDLGDYGTFGTIGAALAALAAGLATMKRNKVTSISAASTDAQYPSAKCVYDGLSKIPYDLPATAITPTDGAPFVLAACFPIKYTDGGSTITIAATDADDVTVDADSLSVYYNSTLLFYVTAYGRFGDTTLSSLTFGENDDTPDSSTQVLGFTPTYALADRTTNYIVLDTLPENGIALAFPGATAGKVRDFLVRLVIPAGDAPQIAYPSDVKFGNGAGEFPEINTTDTTGATAETILMFTETAPYVANATPAKFFVKGEAWNEIGGAA